jgi:hypothetical protein
VGGCCRVCWVWSVVCWVGVSEFGVGCGGCRLLGAVFVVSVGVLVLLVM